MVAWLPPIEAGRFRRMNVMGRSNRAAKVETQAMKLKEGWAQE